MVDVVLADDHRLFRASLAHVLGDVEGLRVVAEVDCGEDAVDWVRAHPDVVVLMDLAMPGIGGLEATRRITRINGSSPVVIVSAHADEPFPTQALDAGASGYVSKNVAASEVATAVRKVVLGGRYMSSDVAQNLALRSFERFEASPFEVLSSREMQITLMVINCQKVQEISQGLHLSPKTVNSYRYRIFEKLNVRSDVELALLAVRHGMIDPDRARVSAQPKRAGKQGTGMDTGVQPRAAASR
ncbi:MAG: UvrY/SirA/GacA family response regulator transcription factor [Pseudomonadaceae bacterium]|nr:UvrY/SirA/GacA family response regulator transcription factor [Pseudomonadaceae bacterium]